MRIIEGYVVTVAIDEPVKQELLFGPVVDKLTSNHQNFTDNELTPFPTQESANLGLEGIRARTDLKSTATGLATLKMELTDSREEWDLIKKNNSFILVAGVDYGYLLLGRVVTGVPPMGHMPVSELLVNGYQTFKDFNFVTKEGGAFYEVSRQGRPHTLQLATFKMNRISDSDTVYNYPMDL